MLYGQCFIEEIVCIQTFLASTLQNFEVYVKVQDAVKGQRTLSGEPVRAQSMPECSEKIAWAHQQFVKEHSRGSSSARGEWELVWYKIDAEWEAFGKGHQEIQTHHLRKRK